MKQRIKKFILTLGIVSITGLLISLFTCKPIARKSIAIITQNTSPFCSEIITGITNCTTNTFSYSVFSAENNPLLLTCYAETVMNGSFDAVIAIAAQAAQVTRTVQQKRALEIPLIFIGVRDPVNVGLVLSEEHPGVSCTGITLNNLPLTKGAEVLLSAAPSISSVLIPYCPSSNAGATEKEAYAVKQFLNKKDISVTLLPVTTPHEAIEKTHFSLLSHESILILTDGVVTDAVEGIAKIASSNAIPLVAFNLASINAGATAAWGGNYESIGQQAHILLKKVLIENQKTSETPVLRISGWDTIVIR